MRRLGAILAAACMAFAAPNAARAQDPAKPPPQDLADLSLEELMRIEVTTASRKEQRLMDIPAAVAVIRGEDIRRTGVRSIPEALRMVPGTNVARIDGSKYALSIRGFSDRFANKLQVLIDGRSVYSQLFSGVFWERQGAFMEDIDRIEVIRGPGGAVWGANAVNGVINIITKSSKNTQGGLIYAGAGSEERAFGGARYGGGADGFHYRAYGQGYDRDEQHDGADDNWQARGGFRMDWDASKEEVVTFLGEAYTGRAGSRTNLAAPFPVFVQPNTEHAPGAGGHVLARWERTLSEDGRLSVQAAYTHTDLNTSFFGEKRDILDFDVTHRFVPIDGHDVIWGLGYRWTRDNLADSFSVKVDPEEERDDVVSAFLQDEIQLAGDAFKLTLGCRVEHNDYTGLEVQPSGRLGLRLHERHLLWTAVSRAVRTPSRGENDIDITGAVFPAGPPPAVTELHILGNRDVKAEELIAYEAGYRLQPADALTLDIAVFFNDYRVLRSTEPAGAGGAPPTTFLFQKFDDEYRGHTTGAEFALTWQAAKGVRIYGAYTFLKMNLIQGDSLDAAQEASERNDAKGQAYVRASLDLVENVSVDLIGRYVGPLSNRNVDAYSEADVRVAWRATPALELSVVGQNLLHDEHFESNNSGLTEEATEVERGFYLMASWQF